MHIFNSISKQKENFIPIDDQHIRLYVCGPTVYDFIHFGNARPLVVFDTLYRLLKHDYPRVTYVRNITDIDDKIIQRSEEENVAIEDFVRCTTQNFHNDIDKLGILPTDFEPKATDYIASMISMIEKLVANGHAYLADQHVLFRVDSYSEYGRLSGRTLDEQIDGARIEVAGYKKNPRDFILWKPSSEQQPGWDSPWGYGRPGWHIECSAMSAELLGSDFDIHGGGRDLLFPHHENERAQSCCAYPDSGFARYWMHNGFVTVQGEKMSKSLGNFITLHELLDQFPAQAVRFVLLSSHYRKPMDYDDTQMQQTLNRLRSWGKRLFDAGITPTTPCLEVVDVEFLDALRDDLNTPKALARLSVLAKSNIHALWSALNFLGFAPQELLTDVGQRSEIDNAEIDALVAQRLSARKAKDFAGADAIRDGLAVRGISIIDDAQGSHWKVD